MDVNDDFRDFKGYILLLAWLIYFCFGLINSAFAPLIVPIISQLRLTYTEVGAIAGSWQLVYIFAAYPAGIIVDRLGFKKTLLLGVAIISVSSFLRARATNFESLFAYTALFGLGGPLISIGLPKLVASWFSGEERRNAIGIYSSGLPVGTATGLALTNLVLHAVGSWGGVFVIYGLIGCLIAIIWGFRGRESYAPENKEAHKFSNSVKKIFKLRSVWSVMFIGITSFVAIHALQNWLPTILEIGGYTATEAGFVASLHTLSRIPGSLFIPKASYYVESKKIIALILLFSSFMLLALGVTGGLALITGILVLGFLLGGLIPLLLLILMDVPEIGAEYVGMAGGLFFSIGEIGGFAGPFIIGFLMDLSGSFLVGFVILSIYTGSMILLTRAIKDAHAN